MRVWVTGASSGLGEAVGHLYATKKARLVLSSRREEALSAVAETCVEMGAAEALVVPMDQSVDVGPAIEAALAAFGGFDVVVLNGGVSTRASALETEPQTLERVVKVNFSSHAEIARRCAQHMLAEGVQGRIVVTSSVQAYFGLPMRSAYAASKHALLGYFDSLRAELADTGISVTVAAPGYIRTALSTNALTGDGSLYGQTDATTARGADPSEVARILVSAADRRTPEIDISPGLSASVARYLRTLAPSLFFQIMAKRARTS
ncbi:hypothetical protein CTAYLR_005394 [Chrysophaeum taylorii]|uniref:Ketoreductase domain-containing protein n=1 Tax=Chrysophaeum taylorii TaxID=2483200 RepID=A0AAD7U892_9STRA|nr:hypothetical protein CTAYLR_005394 [Chrysophaeum taylorii]